MQVKILKLKNFKQYRDADISFPEGLIGFIGKNGAGKSTLFEAITFALFGKSDANKDSIRNDKVSPKDEVLVELFFEDRGKDYRIVRKYKGKTLSAEAELFAEGRSLCSSVKEVNRQILTIIKIDYDNFCSSFFAHQKDVGVMLDIKEKDRSALLRKMLGLDILDKMGDKLKEKQKTLKSELHGLREGALTGEQESQHKEDLEKLQDEKSHLSAEAAALELSVAEAEKIFQEADLVYKELAEKRDEHGRLENNLALQNMAIETNKQRLEALHEKIKNLEALVIELNKLLPVREKYDALKGEMENLQQQKQKKIQREGLELSFDQLVKELQNKKNVISQLQTDIREHEDAPAQILTKNSLLAASTGHLETLMQYFHSFSAEKGKLAGKQSDTQNRLNKITHLGSEAPCTECERPLGGYYNELVTRYRLELSETASQIASLEEQMTRNHEQNKELSTHIEELRNEVQFLTAREATLKSLLNTLNRTQKELEQLENRKSDLHEAIAQLGEVSFDENFLLQTKTQLQDIEPEYKRTFQIQGEVAELEHVKTEEKDTANKLDLAVRARDAFQKSMAELGFREDVYRSAAEAKETAEVDRTERKLILIQKQGEIKTKEAEIRGREESISRNEKIKNDIQLKTAEVNLYNTLETSVKIFKEKVTSQELPKISSIASGYFNKITRGRFDNLRITENFELKVLRDGLDSDVSTLSGGEKDLAALCLRIAISKRISSLAGRQNMGFLALDEVFGSQDRERREELLLALNVISKEFKQIFVVSHNEDVQDQFPHRLNIIQKGGNSTVQMI